MAGYEAPAVDMAFTLNEVVGLAELAELPTFSDVGLDIVPDLLEEAKRFFSEVVAPTNRIGDTVGSQRNSDGSVTTPDGFKEAYDKYVSGGWGGMSFEPEFGGGGFPWVVGIAVSEMMTAANMALSLNPLLTQGAIHALLAHGSDEQKNTWLPKLISGEWTGTMNLTESQAGSDVGALTTKAEPRPDGSWLISGQKIFITWGEHDMTDNIVHLVLARTPDSPPGTRGISLFIVPKFILDADDTPGERNDVECVSIEHKLGIHGSPTCVLQFGDNGGAVGYLIGHERLGMGYMFTMMNQARLAVGLEGVALADRAYGQALQYAAERQQGRRPDTPKGQSAAIIEHPDVRRMLMTMRANIEAARALIYLNAYGVDMAHHHPDEDGRRAGQELSDLLTPLSKAWGTDLGNEMTSLGVQVHGGMGFIEETGAAQHYRDIRIGAIYEGTNGIQAMDLVGRKLPMRDGQAVQDLIGRIGVTVGDLTAAGMSDIGDRLEAAAADVQAAGRWILEKGAGGTDDGLAAATPYLRMFATTVGAWLLGKSALAARRLLDDGDSTYPADFLEAKIVTARFFATQLLPQVHGLLPAVMAGADDLYAIASANLR
jgi:alkylation response protein AidB-like acyl-CoA dehydrogenase